MAIHSKINNAGKRISDLEDRVMEITQSVQQTVKFKKKAIKYIG